MILQLRDSKKKSDWRTLQQHYYPEGGWGWVVTFCAVSCHAITAGMQIYLSNIVFAQFKRGKLTVFNYIQSYGSILTRCECQ